MIKTICKNCGAEFNVLPYELKRGKGKYCSLSCAGTVGANKLHDTYNQTGFNNPNWKGGISQDYYHYKLIQKDRYPERVKARQDAYAAVRRGKIKKEACTICGNPDTQIHHENYEKPFEITWLCADCHRSIH